MKKLSKVISIVMAFVMVLGIFVINPVDAHASDGITDFVTRCYSLALQRDPDETGLNNWVESIKRGERVGSSVVYWFIFSEEYLAQDKSDEEFVNDLYTMFLGRPADEEGYNTWCGLIKQGWSRQQIFGGFANSVEFDRICSNSGITAGFYTPDYEIEQVNAVNLFVERLYKTCLGRLGDQGGQKTWVEGMLNGTYSGIACAANFIKSDEYVKLNLSNEKYVENLYIGFMGRTFDADGKKMWLDLLNGYEMSRDQVFEGFAKSVEFDNICKGYGVETGDYHATDIADPNNKPDPGPDPNPNPYPSGAGEYEVKVNNSSYRVASGNVTNLLVSNQAADLNLLEGGLGKAGCNGEEFWHNSGISTTYLDGFNYYFVSDTWNNRVLVYKVPESELWGGNDHSLTKYLYCILGQTAKDENKAGCELNSLNWPEEVACAAVDGKIKVYVTDTNNDRILVWENLLDVENSSSENYKKYFGSKASYSIMEKFDFSNADFDGNLLKSINFPNANESRVSWPWSIWTDGTRLMCTSTRDGVLLIWDELPSVSDKYPDRVIRMGGTIRTIACYGNYLLLGDHNINTTDGGNAPGVKIIDDYTALSYTNVPEKTGSKTLFKYACVENGTPGYSYCTEVGQVSCTFLTRDLSIEGGKILKKGTLLAASAGNIKVYYSGKIDPANNGRPDYYIGGGIKNETRIFYFVSADHLPLVFDHNGNLYHSLPNKGNIVGYAAGTLPSEPADMTEEEIKAQDGDVFMYNGQYYWNNWEKGVFEKHASMYPNIWIGSEKCSDFPYVSSYRSQNCMLSTDGKHLVASTDGAGVNSGLMLWKSIPDESGAIPDVMYYFEADNLDETALYQDGEKTMLFAGGTNSIFIWNDIETALAGGKYDRYYWRKVGNVDTMDINSIAYDGEYFYVADQNAIYIFKGIPEDGQNPISQLDYKNAKINVTKCDDGKTYLSITLAGDPVIYTREEALKNGTKYTLKGAVRYMVVGLNGNTISGDKKIEKAPYASFNGASDLIITKDGHVILSDTAFFRVLIWDSIEEAVREGETNEISSSRIELGYGVDLYDNYDVLKADPTNYYWVTSADPVSIESPTTLFRPYSLEYDGKYLWIADFKFSGGIKRFSGLLN